MAYRCPTCVGTGIVGGFSCWNCHGSGELVEDSHGLTVSWGSVDLGRLTGVSMTSPETSLEDVTSVLAPVIAYTNSSGANTHCGVLRRLESGDITPGKVSISWIGTNRITWAMVGHTKSLTVAHPHGALAFQRDAILMRFEEAAGVGELVTGSAEFHIEGL